MKKRILFPTLNRKGFTFIELLMGAAITIVIIGAIAGFLLKFSRSQEKLVDRSQVDSTVASVYERIRSLSIDNFDNMTETNINRTPANSQIRIFSTIAPTDLSTRTRKVTLVAKWQENGRAWIEGAENFDARASTFTYLLTPIRGLKPGVQVDVRIVKDNDPSTGVPNVLVKAKGEHAAEVYTQTGPDGWAYLYGVFASVGPVDVIIDATPTRAYFAGPPHLFTKKLQTTNTKPGDVVPLGTHKVIPPGGMSGTVRDALTGDPVVGGRVYFVPQKKVNPSILPYTPLPGDLPINEYSVSIYTDTDGSGNFLKTGLLPAKYCVFFQGNEEYAGLDRVDSNLEANRVYHTVTMDTVIPIKDPPFPGNTMYGLRKGIVTGDVITVKQNVSNTGMVTTTDDVPNVRLRSFRTPTVIRVGATPFDFANSLWRKHGPGPFNESTATVTNADGTFEFRYDVPAVIIDNGVAYPNDATGVPQRRLNHTPSPLRVSTVTPSPATPVIVQGLFGHTANRFLALSEKNKILTFPTVPATDLDLFDHNFFANGSVFSTNSNRKLYVLHKEAYSNMKGKVTFSPPVPLVNLEKHYVRTFWGKDTLGDGAGGLVSLDGKMWLKEDYAVNTVPVSGSEDTEHTYNMASGNADGQFPLLPNVGDTAMLNHTRIIFIGEALPGNADREFEINMAVVTKAYDVGLGIWVSKLIPDVVIPGLEMYFRKGSATGPFHAPAIVGKVAANKFTDTSDNNILHAAEKTDRWTKVSNWKRLLPGADVEEDLTVTNPPKPVHTDYYLIPLTSSFYAPNDAPTRFQVRTLDNIYRQYTHPTDNSKIGAIVLYERSYLADSGPTSGVYGKLYYAATGANMTKGATVRLWRSGKPTPPPFVVLPGSNNFYFNALEFLPLPGDNLCIKVESTGFTTTNWHCTEAGGPTVTWNINISLTAVSGGSGPEGGT